MRRAIGTGHGNGHDGHGHGEDDGMLLYHPIDRVRKKRIDTDYCVNTVPYIGISRVATCKKCIGTVYTIYTRVQRA